MSTSSLVAKRSGLMVAVCLIVASCGSDANLVSEEPVATAQAATAVPGADVTADSGNETGDNSATTSDQPETADPDDPPQTQSGGDDGETATATDNAGSSDDSSTSIDDTVSGDDGETATDPDDTVSGDDGETATDPDDTAPDNDSGNGTDGDVGDDDVDSEDSGTEDDGLGDDEVPGPDDSGEPRQVDDDTDLYSDLVQYAPDFDEFGWRLIGLGDFEPGGDPENTDCAPWNSFTTIENFFQLEFEYDGDDGVGGFIGDVTDDKDEVDALIADMADIAVSCPDGIDGEIFITVLDSPQGADAAAVASFDFGGEEFYLAAVRRGNLMSLLTLSGTTPEDVARAAQLMVDALP